MMHDEPESPRTDDDLASAAAVFADSRIRQWGAALRDGILEALWITAPGKLRTVTGGGA